MSVDEPIAGPEAADEASRVSGARSREVGFADRLVDELMPVEVEWRRVVHRFPRLALVAAFGAGVFLGRSRGRALLAAASGFVMSEATHRVETLFSDSRPDRDR